MHPRALFAITVLALSAACVRVSTTRIAPTGPAIAPDSVRVFATQSPGDYTELAVLRVHRFLARNSQVVNALRHRAAELGANGLLLLNTRGVAGVRGSGSGVVIGGPRDGEVILGTMQTDVDEFQRAIAIVYRPR
jgi:hypothetical protein